MGILADKWENLENMLSDAFQTIDEQVTAHVEYTKAELELEKVTCKREQSDIALHTQRGSDTPTWWLKHLQDAVPLTPPKL